MSAPLSNAELAEIRAEHERTTHPGWRDSTAVGVLLREVDRLRALVADYQGEVVRYDADHERLSAELNAAKSQIHAASTVKCWTNEDGRRFVFAEDLAFALGYTPTATSLVDDGQPMADAEIEAVEYGQRALGAGQ